MGLLKVHVISPDAAMRSGVLTTLRRAGVALSPEPQGSQDTVIVAAAGTVDEALHACPPKLRSDGHHMLVVADRFSPADVVRALRSGIRAMLRSTDTTPSRLVAALHSAQDGDGRLPYEVLVGALGGVGTGTPPPATTVRTLPGSSPLTARQTKVLALMAEGQDNAMIARSLVCSEHTVKNVIYDLMARLQVRNRAHAVACGVQAGLI
jgi:DNA-binding NarL/FixJ family response regulator